MKTPYIHALAALATMAGMTLAAEERQDDFWSYADQLAGADIIAEQSSERGYRLTEGMTRAEAVKIAVLLSGDRPGECTGKTFTDVTGELGDLCGFAEAGARLGIVSATRTFRPTDPVTRTEMTRMFLGTGVRSRPAFGAEAPATRGEAFKIAAKALARNAAAKESRTAFVK